MTRRERLIKFIEPWARDLPQLYRPHIGSSGLGFRLMLEHLTDRALELLAGEIVDHFWRTKRHNRQNRERMRASS